MGLPIDLVKLDGTWRLQYTSAPDVLILSKLPLDFLSFRLGKYFKNLSAEINQMGVSSVMSFDAVFQPC
uniref:Plastid lipid-associated protein/fibrillin conserved domain-containing protein n=1 Tax=Quercus lobata TaxID=97700 RepID=A0A7N2LUN5_QUELO